MASHTHSPQRNFTQKGNPSVREEGCADGKVGRSGSMFQESAHADRAMGE